MKIQIKNGIYTLKDKQGGRSAVWSFYKEIFNESGSVVKGLVWCTHCEKALAHSNNTSNLSRHKCILKDQHQDEQPLAKRAREEETDDINSEDSNEDLTFLSESEYVQHLLKRPHT